MGVEMQEYFVGTGGWAYFPVKDLPRLKAYSNVFNFVEVNYTFYEYPDPRTVEKWRRMVPRNFAFSVRCNQELTHRIGLNSTKEAHAVLDKMLTYCKILQAPFLVLETPSSYILNDDEIESATELLSSAILPGLNLVWENRGPISSNALKMIDALKIVHSADLSKETPLFPSDVVYTRLFGKGKHNIYQFTDEELKKIDHRVLMSGAKTIAMSYHGVRMNTDALRFIQYKKTGKFPSITGLAGASSAAKILEEDTRFPISKQALIRDQGWKVFDATSDSRLHLSDLLEKIPKKTYASLQDLTKSLEAIQ
jgi:uncharacterized protein YecE (DUF72 family)